jgi:hypothetical protein
MSLNNAPYWDPPSRPILLTMPPEMLHIIFSELQIQDILRIRETCSLLAAVALDFRGDDVNLTFHRNQFRDLIRIAAHPKFSKQMRSLFYVGDRCKLRPFEVWRKLRPDPRPWERDQYDHKANIYTELDYRRMMEEDKECKDAIGSVKRLDAVSESDCRVGHAKYTALCMDQGDLERDGYDFQCLRVLFQGCSNIQEITIASEMDWMRGMNAGSTLYADAMTTPQGDRHWKDANVRQVLALAVAAQEADLRLDSLTISHVSPLLFDRVHHIGEDGWGAIRALVQPLRRLRLYLHVQNPERQDHEDEVDDRIARIQWLYKEARELFAAGPAHDILSSARELRVLSLHLPKWHSGEISDAECPYYLKLGHALRYTTYPHLYELSLGSCGVSADYLLDLLLRHRTTLRRLALSNIDLTDGRNIPGNDWQHLLTRLSRKLLKLRELKLRGQFYTDGWIAMSFEAASDRDPGLPAYSQDALQDYVINGGSFPMKHVGTPSGVDNPSGESLLRSELPHDDFEPDDPARDYEEDGFDDRIYDACGRIYMQKIPLVLS